LERVRKHLPSGRPLLNYVVTMSGHYPYELNPVRRPEVITAKPELGVFEKIVNHAYYVSKDIADYVDELQRIDPGSLIVMFSDHVPPEPASAYREFDYLGGRNAKEDLLLHLAPLFVIDRGEPVPVGVVPHYLLPELIVDRLSDGAYCASNPCQSKQPGALRPPFLVDRGNPLRAICDVLDRPLHRECASAASLDRKLNGSFQALVRASHPAQ